MAGLQHEYIMKFYGAVILGSYADSVGLVTIFVLLPYTFRDVVMYYSRKGGL